MNIKRLSDLDTFARIKAWLEKCGAVYRLDFNVKQRVGYDIKSLRRLQDRRRIIRPKTLDKLKVQNPLLYTRLQKEGVIH